MPNRVVLIPFPEKNSSQHLISTRGGSLCPEVESVLLEAQSLYWESLRALAREGKPTDPAVLKNSADPTLRARGVNLERIKRACEQSEAAWNQSIKRGWKNIKHSDVICTDTKGGALALENLKNANDALFIRGHCSPGSNKISSSDQSMSITADDLVKLLDGKLDRKFSGRIKIFACDSSTDTVDSESFAMKFAIGMSNAGWINCKFFGYNTLLMTFVHQVSGERYTGIPTDDGSFDFGVRARSARETIQVPTHHTELSNVIEQSELITPKKRLFFFK